MMFNYTSMFISLRGIFEAYTLSVYPVTRAKIVLFVIEAYVKDILA